MWHHAAYAHHAFYHHSAEGLPAASHWLAHTIVSAIIHGLIYGAIFHLFAGSQSVADLVEKGLHQRFALPMGQAYVVYQVVRKLFLVMVMLLPLAFLSTNGPRRAALPSIRPHQPDIRARNRRALSAHQNTHGGTIPFPVLVLRLARIDCPVPLYPRRQDADPQLDGREIPLRRLQAPQFFTFHQNAPVGQLIAGL
jgi:hypothetical protein